MAAPFTGPRPYQILAIEALHNAMLAGFRALILQLATGGGKTVIFAEITRRTLAKGKRVLIVAHRRELIRQASAKLDWLSVPHGIIAAGLDCNPNAMVQVASIQTLARRLDLLPQFDLIVIDECHHTVASTYVELIARQPKAFLLGVTATPWRMTGKGLGQAAGGPFDYLVCGPSTSTLIKDGYLSPVRCFVPRRRVDTSKLHIHAGDYNVEEAAAAASTAAIVGDAIEHYAQRADHRPALVFCANVAHSEFIARELRGAGYRAFCVHGKQPHEERDALIAGLGNGQVEILTSCELINEGLDVPSVTCVVLLRPTKSLVLHRQQIGRGMRLDPDKPALIVNDHCGNCLVHGLPEIEPRWSLADAAKAKGEAPVWQCPECSCVVPLAVAICPNCGFERPVDESRRKPPRKVPGTLIELSADNWKYRLPTKEFERRFVDGEFTESEAYIYASIYGFKRGWVWHLVQARMAREAQTNPRRAPSW